jgi:hypothetical protein
MTTLAEMIQNLSPPIYDLYLSSCSSIVEWFEKKDMN